MVMFRILNLFALSLTEGLVANLEFAASGPLSVLEKFRGWISLVTCVTDTSDPGWENTVQVFSSPLQNRSPFPIFLMAAIWYSIQKVAKLFTEVLEKVSATRKYLQIRKYSSKRKMAFSFIMQFGQGIKQQNLDGLGGNFHKEWRIVVTKKINTEKS